MTSRSNDSTDETTSQRADDGSSNVAGATICFTPEPSVRPRPSPDDEYGADDESHGLDSENSMKSMTLQDLQAVIGHELDKKSEMQQRLAATESQLSASNKQKEELAGKLGKTQEANVTPINQVNKLLERLDTKDTSLSNAQAEKGGLCSVNASLRSGIELLRQQLSESQANREHNEDQLESLRQQLSDSQATQNRTLSELRQVQANLIEATSNLDEKSNQLTNELTGSVAMLEALTNDIRSELQDSRVEHQQAASASALQSTVASLQSDIEQKLAEIQSLREQLNLIQDPDEVQLTSTSKIDFDDVTTGMWADIPNGYKGLDWDNFGVIHRSQRPGTGYEYGVVSGNYSARNWHGFPCSISSKMPFSVAGFQATAAGRTGVEVLVEGFDGSGKLVDSRRTTLGDPRDGPAFVDLRGGNFEDLLKLKITPSGGANAGCRAWFQYQAGGH